MGALLDALALGPHAVVSVVGAGGKTTLAYRLAHEAHAAGLRALVTTTTHMGQLPEEVTGPVFLAAEGDFGGPLREALQSRRLATLLGRRVRPDKVAGVSGDDVDALRDAADLVLVEADGARGRSLKTPADHEPVFPSTTTLVLVVAALDALGKPLDDGCVHRVDHVMRAAGAARGAPIDEALFAATLKDPEGYLSRLPGGAPRAGVFLNKAEEGAQVAAAERIAARLVPPYSFALAGSAREGTVRCRR